MPTATKQTVTVDVTAEDIANGLVKNCFVCPVARAARRIFPESRSTIYIAVTPTHIRIGDYRPATSETASEFVRRFDTGLPVEPFSFTLELEPA